MWCKIYQLCDEHGRLDREAARATGREAWLEYGKNKIGTPGEKAWARDARGVEIEMLKCARVRFVRGGGVMIDGLQIIEWPGPRRSFDQRWWCVPIGGASQMPVASALKTPPPASSSTV